MAQDELSPGSPARMQYWKAFHERQAIGGADASPFQPGANPTSPVGCAEAPLASSGNSRAAGAVAMAARARSVLLSRRFSRQRVARAIIQKGKAPSRNAPISSTGSLVSMTRSPHSRTVTGT